MLRQCSTDTSPRLVPTPGKVIFFQVCSYVLPTTFPALDFVKSRPSRPKLHGCHVAEPAVNSPCKSFSKTHSTNKAHHNSASATHLLTS